MHVFITSVQSVVAILIMIAVGYYTQGLNWFGEKFNKGIAKIILKVTLPCGIFMSMLKHFLPDELSKLSVGLIYAVVSLGIGYIIAWIIVRVMKVPKGRRGLMMTAFNGANTVFIGMPLNQALFGTSAIPYVLVYYIVNTIIIWTLGVWVIAADDPTVPNGSKAQFDWHHLIPAPLWGFIIALPFVFSPALKAGLMKCTFITLPVGDLGKITGALSLIYIGVMLRRAGLKSVKFNAQLIMTIIGRFVICPIIMGCIIWFGYRTLGINMAKTFSQTLVIQAATPSLAVLPILAENYNCDVDFATSIVVSTSVLFIIVVPVIMLLQNI